MEALKVNTKQQIRALLPKIIEMKERATMASIYRYFKDRGEISCAFSTFRYTFYSLNKQYPGQRIPQPPESALAGTSGPPKPAEPGPPQVKGASSISKPFDIDQHQNLSNAYFEAYRRS